MEIVSASRKTLMIKGNTSLFIAIICLIILCGCAKKEVLKSASDEEVLQARINEYWGLVTKEDYIKSYEYEDPLYRKAVSINQYIKSYTEMLKIKEVGIKTVDIKDNTGNVVLKTKIELQFPGAKPLVTESERKDQWGKIDGIWYHVKYSGKQGVKGN